MTVTAAKTEVPTGLPGSVELHGGHASAVLLPALGGKIRDVTFGGRQWLWHNPEIPFAPLSEPGSYAESGDSGGFDDCFPTVAPCNLPTWVKGAGERPLPDHGELWTRTPELTITTHAGGHAATCAWTGDVLPYRFVRMVTLRPGGEIEFSYAAENTGEQRMPFLWASHPLFPLTDRTRIVLPERARTRVWTQRGVEFGRPGAEHQWPRVRDGGLLVDLSRPGVAPGPDFACKLFVDLPKTDLVLALEEGDARLEMHMHGREIPHVGVWINRRGWTPFASRPSRIPFIRRKPKPYSNLVLGPCAGAPDSLADALGAWNAAQWIEPGATLRWSMVWRGVTLSDAIR